ncbi:MAG: ATP-binding protein [Treponema sp.]|jgi:predicted AAA+ superfamily ATPase|nr:ATP-binding protein [Treponema sp.]
MIEIEPKYISRSLYIEQIHPYVGSRIIKVITGQRRAGKSYILYGLIDEIKKENPKSHILYINTELAEFWDLKNGVDLYDYIVSQLQKGKDNYVFIDEIQEIEGFENALKSLFAENLADLYITGSNSHLLSGELATYLSGRYIMFTVHTLSYREFLVFHRLEKGQDSLNKYLRIGGMPYLASLGTDENLSFEYLKNVYESILLRDVVFREKIRNVRFLENLSVYLADNTGSLFSANNISKYLKSQKIQMPVQTVISYLKALESSYLIHRVQRKEIGGLKIFEIGEKYYFEDLGLRNVLARKDPVGDRAKLMENAVYLSLLQRGYTVYVGKLDNGEIDFVAEKQNELVYIQVCWRLGDDNTWSRETGRLLEIKDNFPKYVVTMDSEFSGQNYQGIKIESLENFLDFGC